MGFGQSNRNQSGETEQDVEIESGGRFRWLPGAVVTVAFAGFIALAWHAYHYGAQSVEDGQLVVVEAEDSPIKEKPLDPGGMKFPNQDKTVFETFASNGSNPPKVERIMPPPEEPMPKNIDTSETKTWINDKLKPDAGDETAHVAAVEEEPTQSPEKTKPDAQEAKSVDIVKNEKKSQEVVKPQQAKREDVNASKQTPASKAVVTKVATGNQRVQLGAYGSEEEARGAWSKMQAKFPELKDKTVYVVKAELGAKGTFYRLRAGGFADAKRFCTGLTAKGQACMMVP